MPAFGLDRLWIDTVIIIWIIWPGVLPLDVRVADAIFFLIWLSEILVIYHFCPWLILILRLFRAILPFRSLFGRKSSGLPQYDPITKICIFVCYALQFCTLHAIFTLLTTFKHSIIFASRHQGIEPVDYLSQTVFAIFFSVYLRIKRICFHKIYKYKKYTNFILF